MEMELLIMLAGVIISVIVIAKDTDKLKKRLDNIERFIKLKHGDF